MPPPKVIVVALNPSIDRGLEVPNLVLGAHQTARLLFRRPAGKPVNLAHTLGALGKIPTVIIGFIGRGEQDDFEHHLTEAGVECQFLPVAGRTRENITLVDPVRRMETHLRDRGFDVSSAEVSALKRRLADACSAEAIVVFNGSLPPGLAVGDFVELVGICRRGGARVAIDVGGPALRACRSVGVWLIKPNAEELSEMLETRLETAEDIVRAGPILRQGVETALVSAGAKGAFLFSPAGDFQGYVPLDPADVRNTVGCGDALLAGFLIATIAGKSAPDALGYALATATAAAVAVTPGELDRSAVERFLPLVRIVD